MCKYAAQLAYIKSSLPSLHHRYHHRNGLEIIAAINDAMKSSIPAVTMAATIIKKSLPPFRRWVFTSNGQAHLGQARRLIEMNYARDLVAGQRLCRTCRHTGRSAAQTADVRRIQPFRVDLGHFDTGVRDAKAPFMPNYTGHFTCPATAAHLFSCPKSL